MKNRVLVIVDFQFDFYDKENGALYVPGAENVIGNICNEIESGKYTQVCLTCDWHKPNDESFEKEGGQWPVHCVQNTIGAAIHPDIFKSIEKAKIPYTVFYKGDCTYHEEYGAFELKNNLWASSVSENVFTNYSRTSSFVSYLKDDITFSVCGLAGDYCCKETVRNLVKHGVNVEPLYDCMAWINGKQTYENMINIGLYFGSFDPPHIGHTLCVVDACNSKDFDGISIIPTWQNPWKEKSSSYNDRLEMCKNHFNSIASEIPIVINDIERTLKSEYTYITLECILSNSFKELVNKNHLVKFTIIGGTDVKEDIKLWKNGEWILENFDVYEVKRDSNSPRSINISSTELRQMIKNGENVSPFIIPDVESKALMLYKK